MFSRQQYFCTALANFPAAGSIWKRGGIATLDKKLSHFQAFGLKVFIFTAKGAKTKKLRERNRLLGVVRMTRFGEHRRSVTSNDVNQPVARHSNNGSHCFSDMKIRALCPISGSNDSFIVSLNRVSLNTLPTLATLVRDINTIYEYSPQ